MAKGSDRREPVTTEAINAGQKAAREGQELVELAQSEFRLSIESEPAPLPVPKPQPPTLGERITWITRWEAGAQDILAGMGLVRLQEELGLDEPGWEIFVREHFPFTLVRADELIGRMVRRGGLLSCSKCGAEVIPQCTCGVPYHWEHQLAPTAAQTGQSAFERALVAVTAAPRKPLRTIANEIGVSHETVRRAKRIFKRGDRL